MDTFEKKRLLYLRITAGAAAGCLLLLLALGIGLLCGGLAARRYARQAEEILDTLETMTAQLDTVDWASLAQAADHVSGQLQELDVQELIRRLDKISRALAAIDWERLAEGVDSLSSAARLSLEEGQAGLEEAIAAMEKLDIDALNEAIDGLRTVVEPLSRLLGRRS